MKKIHLLYFLSAFISTSGFAQESASNAIAVLVKAVGTVEGSADANTWTKAERGLDLSAGFLLRTMAVSSCVIRFNDGTLLNLKPESHIKLAGARATDVQTGKLTFAIKTNSAEPFKFVSPTAVGAIKGTEGEFEVSNDETELSIFSSDRKDDIADLTLLKDNRTEKLGIGERVRFTREGRPLRRLLSATERKTFGERLKTLRADSDKGMRFIQRRREQMQKKLQRPQNMPKTGSLKRHSQLQQQQMAKLRLRLQR